MKRLTDNHLYSNYSDILAEDLESLLEASHELAHVSQQLVLMIKPVAHFTLQVVHESVSLVRCLLLKVLQERAGHVCALSEHVIKVTKSFLSRALLVLDVCVHLSALTVDVGHDLLFVGDASLLLLNESVSDAFDLRTDRVQSIIVVLYAVSFLLLDSSLELIPESQSNRVSKERKAFQAKTYMRL